ncbi:MAG: TetR family transcriptional regulator [Rhizobiales bacterium]|nr:TetR family transcriptional regulator [Hyphomicrobiales bacterium]
MVEMTNIDEQESPTRRRYRGASPAERVAQRRVRLIEAALSLYGTAGYATTPVKAVCVEAGLTERYFYESFANREELFAALYQHIVEEMGNLMVDAMAKVPEETEIRARILLDTYFGKIANDPVFARVLLLEVLGVSELVHQAYRDAMQRFTDVVQRHVLPPFAEPDHSPENIVAAGLVGAIVHVAMRWVISDFARPQADVVDGLMTIFRAVAAQRPAL